MAYFDIGGAEPLIVKLPGTSVVKTGDEIAIGAEHARLHLFDGSGLRLT